MDLVGNAYFDGALVIARVTMAAIFIYSGVEKLLGWPGVIDECKAFKLPAPKLIGALTIPLHILGGIALALGFFVTPVALALAVFTFFATLLAHNFWVHKGIRFVRELTTALEHFAIIGALLLLAAIYA